MNGSIVCARSHLCVSCNTRFNEPPFPQKTAHYRGRSLDPIYYMATVPSAHPNRQPKRNLDRFSRFLQGSRLW